MCQETLRRWHDGKQITYWGSGRVPQHRNKLARAKTSIKYCKRSTIYQCLGEEQKDGRGNSPTRQLYKIVVPWPGSPLLVWLITTAKVLPEFIVSINKCFSTKTNINKSSTNTFCLPTVVHCQIVYELQKQLLIFWSEQHSSACLYWNSLTFYELKSVSLRHERSESDFVYIHILWGF